MNKYILESLINGDNKASGALTCEAALSLDLEVLFHCSVPERTQSRAGAMNPRGDPSFWAGGKVSRGSPPRCLTQRQDGGRCPRRQVTRTFGEDTEGSAMVLFSFLCPLPLGDLDLLAVLTFLFIVSLSKAWTSRTQQSNSKGSPAFPSLWAAAFAAPHQRVRKAQLCGPTLRPGPHDPSGHAGLRPLTLCSPEKWWPAYFRGLLQTPHHSPLMSETHRELDTSFILFIQVTRRHTVS